MDSTSRSTRGVRSAVVTGAARGIGRAIAERLVADGYRVVVTDVDEEAVRATAREIGAVAGLAHDVRDPDGHRRAAAVAREHGPVVAWFNNAGVGTDGNLTDLTDAQVRQLVEVNLLGVLWGMRAALEAFGADGGDIVNTGSLSAFGPVPGLSVYAATKAGVVSITSSAAAELPRRVRVHVACPDGVDTALVASMDDRGRGKQLVHSGGDLLGTAQVAELAVGLLGTSRVVRTLPAWRGGVMRLSGVAPSLTRHAFGLFAAQGRRALSRRS